jgi:hypothetical protein
MLTFPPSSVSEPLTASITQIKCCIFYPILFFIHLEGKMHAIVNVQRKKMYDNSNIDNKSSVCI